MIVGYLSSDGKIYDRKGRFVKDFKMSENEKEIKKLETNSSVYAFWGYIGRVDPEFDVENGLGTMIQTNERLMFIRDFNPRKEFGHHPFFGTAIVETMKARELKKLGLKEYFEVPLDEIIGHTTFNKGIYELIVLTKDLRMITIDVPKDINSPEVLKREITKKELKIMKKEVKQEIKSHYERPFKVMK